MSSGRKGKTHLREEATENQRKKGGLMHADDLLRHRGAGKEGRKAAFGKEKKKGFRGLKRKKNNQR